MSRGITATFLATVLHRICRVLFSECKVFFFGVILTIAVITEYHMSGWSEDGLPLPPIWISQIYGLEYGLDLLHVIQ